MNTEQDVKHYSASIDDIIAGKVVDCPIDVSVIPNHMGINLVAVRSLTWERQADGQLTYLTISFEPAQTTPEVDPSLLEST